MKRVTILSVAVLLLLTGGADRAPAQNSALPTLIVAPLGRDTMLSYWQPAIGSGLAEMLITELGKINKFSVLETTQLEVLKDEIRLGDDGFVASNEKVEKGGWAGADFMFTGKVTQFGNKESSMNLGGFAPRGIGSLGVKQTLANVRIDWRLVDAASRRILKTGSSSGEHRGGGFNIGVGVGGSGGVIGFNNREFMDSALGKATVAALANIVSEVSAAQLPEPSRRMAKAAAATQQAAAVTAAATAVRATPGKVLAAPAKEIIIVSLGTRHGFKEGDKLNLYETVDTKDNNGNVVFTDEKLVGELTLQSVQDERSKASYAGSLDIKPGWVVKGK